MENVFHQENVGLSAEGTQKTILLNFGIQQLDNVIILIVKYRLLNLCLETVVQLA
jgi:hypothetical protein